MQDRYAGDIGDFGKIALLQQIREKGLTIGVNWYKVNPADYERNPDGSFKQEDGKYRIPEKYHVCDEALAEKLLEISKSKKRSIKAIEETDLIYGAKYFNKTVLLEDRIKWHNDALKKLQGTELVFLDPDNGLLVKSVRKSSARSVKYAFYEEVKTYIDNGQSVLVYNHRSRKQESVYFQEIIDKLKELGVPEEMILTITFPRCSIRDYFAICANKDHYKKINSAFETMFSSAWGDKETGICRRSIRV